MKGVSWIMKLASSWEKIFMPLQQSNRAFAKRHFETRDSGEVRSGTSENLKPSWTANTKKKIATLFKMLLWGSVL